MPYVCERTVHEKLALMRRGHVAMMQQIKFAPIANGQEFEGWHFSSRYQNYVQQIDTDVLMT